MFGSPLPALLWGVAFANIVRGVPLDAEHEYVGTLLDLLNPYALLGGLATLLLFTLHGAVFLALKTDGDVRSRAGAPGAAGSASPPCVVGGGFLLWTQFAYGAGWTLRLGARRGRRAGRRARREPAGARGLGVRCAPRSRSSRSR